MSRWQISGSYFFILFIPKRILGSFPENHFSIFGELNGFWQSESCNLPHLKATLIYSIIKL